MGHFDGRVCVDRRRVRQLRARAGRRSGRAGRRVRAGLPAPSRIAHLRHRPAPTEDRAAEARVMPHDALFAALAAAIPGGLLESAPSVDVHETAYVVRNETT